MQYSYATYIKHSYDFNSVLMMLRQQIWTRQICKNVTNENCSIHLFDKTIIVKKRTISHEKVVFISLIPNVIEAVS